MTAVNLAHTAIYISRVIIVDSWYNVSVYSHLWKEIKEEERKNK